MKRINTTIRPILMRRLLELTLIAILIVAIVMAYQLTKSQRQHVRRLEQAQAEQPRLVAERMKQEKVLATHHAELARLEQQLLSYEAVGQFIELLEKQATARQIALKVPEIKELVEVSENGTPIERTGPIYEIDVTLLAIGSPIELVQFLYELEHAPYLARVVDWRLDMTGREVPGVIGHATSPEAEQKIAGPQSVLDAHLILGVSNHETQP